MTLKDKYILFYGFDWPSNFADSPITVNDEFCNEDLFSSDTPKTITFSTAEAYYQSRKAVFVHDKENFYKILNAKTPGETKKIARNIKLNPKEWDKVKVKYMWETLRLKFEQNPDLKKELLDQKNDNKIFVEASPYDKFWGVGASEEQILKMIELNEDPLGFDFKTDLPRCMNMLGGLLTKLRKFYTDKETNKTLFQAYKF